MGKLFDQLVSLYRIVDFHGDAVGVLRLDDEKTISLARGLLNRDPDDTGLAVLSGDPERLALGQELTIRANPPPRSIGVLVENLEGLLKAGRIREPNAYYVLSERYSNDDAPAPAEIMLYRKVLVLIELLGESAAYIDERADELVFIRDVRFALPINFQCDDLDSTLGTKIDRLAALFNKDVHLDQKLAILASVVQETTSGAEPKERFGSLLARLDEVTLGVVEGYRLFASNFSYEKIKSDVQDAHIEFTGRIHKTFSDIQSQLLAIPVATVIVATQMRYADGLGSQFWINTGVALGSLIFVTLFGLLVRNQWHTLDVIGAEIDRRENAIAKDHEAISDLFEEPFRKLRDRLKSQRIIMAIVLVVVIAALIATLVVYAFLLDLSHPVTAPVAVGNAR